MSIADYTDVGVALGRSISDPAEQNPGQPEAADPGAEPAP